MKIKRIYEEPETADGYRILVDRVWPRGLSKEKAKIDEWDKEIAPSTELRKWFAHQPELFKEFSKKYKAELKSKTEDIDRIRSISKKKNLTILYSAKDTKHNQAVVLMEVLKSAD